MSEERLLMCTLCVLNESTRKVDRRIYEMVLNLFGVELDVGQCMCVKCYHQIRESHHLKDNVLRFQARKSSTQNSKETSNNIADANSRYSCGTCSKPFMFRSKYLRHLASKSHLRKSVSVLEVKTESGYTLNAGVNDQPSFSGVRTCELCPGSTFRYAETLKLHKIKRHQFFGCRKCDYYTCSRRAYSTHLRSHLGLTVDQKICRLCFEVFETQKELINHKRTHDERKRQLYSCSLCHRKDFATKRSLNVHKTIDHKMTIRATRLRPVFGSILRNHVDKAKKFECKKCRKCLSTKYSLKRHMRTCFKVVVKLEDPETRNFFGVNGNVRNEKPGNRAAEMKSVGPSGRSKEALIFNRQIRNEEERSGRETIGNASDSRYGSNFKYRTLEPTRQRTRWDVKAPDESTTRVDYVARNSKEIYSCSLCGLVFYEKFFLNKHTSESHDHQATWPSNKYKHRKRFPSYSERPLNSRRRSWKYSS